MDEIDTKELIAKKAGYGLARPKWFKTLEEILALPTTEKGVSNEQSEAD